MFLEKSQKHKKITDENRLMASFDRNLHHFYITMIQNYYIVYDYECKSLMTASSKISSRFEEFGTIMALYLWLHLPYSTS